MSIIAWDGTTIAADRQGTINDTRQTLPKLFPIHGHIVGTVGVYETGIRLVEWYGGGADRDDWPKDITEKEWDGTRLLVFAKDGVRVYCQCPVFMPIYDQFAAWGAGRDLAIGAMAMGAGAVRAAEIACQYNVYCGLGVDQYAVADLKPFAAPKRKKRNASSQN